MGTMKMRQMPYKVDDGAIEQAKYRAKLAIREAAHPAENRSRGVQWRWATAIAVAAVVTVGVFAFVKVLDDRFSAETPMEQLIAEMKTASDEIIYDLSVDSGYYLEEENQL